jgi:serine/threonine protein phosphatase 1
MLYRLFSRKGVRRTRVPSGRRVYAIGDIHGRLDLLDRLLCLIKEDQLGRVAVTPNILLLGDLIDRGSDSAGVVRRAMTMFSWAQLEVLMGNHEVAMLEALRGSPNAMRMWLHVGGRESLISWGVPCELIEEGTNEDVASAAMAAIPQLELEWIASLRQYVRIGDYFFVHAGVRPGVDLDCQSPLDSYWIREEFLNSRRDHGALVVHGHSISTDVEERNNRIGIDTGAYATGKLTALCLENDERWFLQT